ncbi:MAG: DUF4349 domain-containing protein [Anaerolineae bacterium]
MKRLALIGILAIALLSACAPAAMAPTAPPVPQEPGFRQSFGGAGSPQDSFAQANKAVGAAPEAPALQAPAATAAPSAADETGRLVIQNADLTIVVADVNARVNAIESMARAMGGFIVSVNVYQTYANNGEQVPQAQVVVRVPQDRLEEALLQVKKDTVDVQNETRSGADVTDQYVDLQSRLKAKQAAEAQMLTIMADAHRTEDVLAVYTQLQQIQSDIEVLKGQIKYLEQSAALSAISVNIIAEATVKPIEVGGWKPQGVARDAIQKLIYFWQDFVNFLIRFFLLVVPMLLTIGIPLFLLFLVARWMFRRMRRPKAVAVVEEPRK